MVIRREHYDGIGTIEITVDSEIWPKVAIWSCLAVLIGLLYFGYLRVAIGFVGLGVALLWTVGTINSNQCARDHARAYKKDEILARKVEALQTTRHR